MRTHYRAQFKGKKRWRIGKISRRLTPHLSACLKCETTWAFVEMHSTGYTSTRGCFPLCEQCWRELATPEARMPFYVALWHQWEQNSDTAEYAKELTETWPLIEAAVLAESAEGT